MMSKQMQRVWDEKVVPMEETLTAYDFSGMKMVEIRHEDGSIMYFYSAFAHMVEPNYIVVFTEHNGTHLFHIEDLEGVREWNLHSVNATAIVDYSDDVEREREERSQRICDFFNNEDLRPYCGNSEALKVRVKQLIDPGWEPDQ